MILRTNIKCLTCGELYTTRISIGHQSRQEHTFICKSCHEEIKIGLDLDQIKIDWDFECVSNCEVTKEPGHIINFHPELMIPEHLKNSDFVSPFLLQAFNLTKNLPHENPDEDMLKDARFVMNVNNEWPSLKQSWSLKLNKKDILSSKKATEEGNSFRYRVQILDVYEWIYQFSLRILQPKLVHLYDTPMKLMGEIALENPTAFHDFKNFYTTNWLNEHSRKFYNIYSEFFKHFNEFNQIMIYHRNDLGIPESYTVTSTNFNDLKHAYGNIYESYTSCLAFIACLNNLKNKRKFNKFATMDLKKYLSIDKAKRADPFKDVACFSIFSECIDSSLRNASHHGDIELDHTTGIIMYKSGKSKHQNTITYTEYLRKCIDIFTRSVVIFMLELPLTR